MKENETINEAPLSLSKQRKLQREKEIKKMKKDALIGKIVGIAVAVLAIAGVIALVVYGINRSINKVTADSNYSAQLDDDGTIKGVTATDLIELADYKNMTASSSDLEYSDVSVAADIVTLMEDYSELSTTTTNAIEDGDKVNIDFVGSIDGEELENGSSNGEGSDVTIGAGELIEGFDTQLIGHTVGEQFDINVTFPDPYENNPDIAGKDAVFTVTINGIYETPEFNDEFVAANLSEYASTADEYRAYIKETKYQENLTAWIQEYMIENSTVNSYPKDFVKQLKALRKYEETEYFENQNNYFYQYLGSYLYANFESYTGMTMAQYDASLKEAVLPQAKEVLIYQAIAEQEGITADEAKYLEYVIAQGQTETDYNSYKETYGLGYLMQQHLAIQVIDLLKTYVTVQ